MLKNIDFYQQPNNSDLLHELAFVNTKKRKNRKILTNPVSPKTLQHYVALNIQILPKAQNQLKCQCFDYSEH